MQPLTIPALTNARLAAREAVDGILLMGSTGAGALTPWSDLDLFLVLTDLPAPLRMVNTWIDGHLAEIYCTTAATIARIVAAPAAWPDLGEAGTVVNWLRSGRIVHDRAGRLARARETARAAAPPALPDARALYAAWLKAAYNIAQTRRKLTAGDPVYLLAVDYRILVYGLGDLWPSYFFARALPWRGELDAIRHFAAHDPDYLDRFWRCAAEPDRAVRLQQYEDLVRLTFAPVTDRLWDPGTTAVGLGAPYGADPADESPGTVADALAFWRSLLDGEGPALPEGGTEQDL